MQVVLSPYIRVSGVHPDLVLLVVVSWVFLRGVREGLVWALMGSLGLELFSAAPFGVLTFSLLTTTIVAGLGHGRLFGSSIVLPLSLTFPLSLLFNGLALVLMFLLGRPVVWLDAFSNVLLPAAIYNTMMMVLVFPPLYLLNRFLNPQPLAM